MVVVLAWGVAVLMEGVGCVEIAAGVVPMVGEDVRAGGDGDAIGIGCAGVGADAVLMAAVILVLLVEAVFLVRRTGVAGVGVGHDGVGVGMDERNGW